MAEVMDYKVLIKLLIVGLTLALLLMAVSGCNPQKEDFEGSSVELSKDDNKTEGQETAESEDAVSDSDTSTSKEVWTPFV